MITKSTESRSTTWDLTWHSILLLGGARSRSHSTLLRSALPSCSTFPHPKQKRSGKVEGQRKGTPLHTSTITMPKVELQPSATDHPIHSPHFTSHPKPRPGTIQSGPVRFKCRTLRFISCQQWRISAVA